MMMCDLCELDIDDIEDQITVLNLERDDRQLVQNEIDELELVLERHYSHADSWSTSEDCKQVKEEIAAAKQADFFHWLSRFDERDVIGEEGSKTDCVMHRFFRQITGVRWDCLEIDLSTTTVRCEHTNEVEEVRLPPFAAQVVDITTYPSMPSLTPGMGITAGWLRDVLGCK